MLAVSYTQAVDSSEEEEGAEQNDYDYSDNFLAREDEDEEPGGEGEGGSDAEGRDGRRKRQREELELDEEDYALVEEATVRPFWWSSLLEQS